MAGYNEMIKRIAPETIICYHYPFPEMQGNILFVDYDLSSWQHYEDDEVELPYTQMEKYLLGIEKSSPNSNIVVKYNTNSFITLKGNGSVHGGQWRPNPDKPEDARFLGKPGEIKETFIPTKKGGYLVKTKIGADGKATKERQFTDHGRSDKHSNPHDQEVIWSGPDNHPSLGKPINYSNGDIPAFKLYKIKGVDRMTKKYANPDYDGDYKTKYEFKQSVQWHSEICFEWQGVEYGIFWMDGDQWLVCLLGTDDSQDVYYKNIDDVMNHKIGNDKLIDICTKFTVIERTF